MPTYDLLCEKHGDEERNCRIADRKEQKCSTCGEIMKQVLLTPPHLDGTAMASIGMPGAIEKQGNQMEKRHRNVDQAHRFVERHV